jgi:hypothetical protein
MTVVGKPGRVAKVAQTISDKQVRGAVDVNVPVFMIIDMVVWKGENGAWWAEDHIEFLEQVAPLQTQPSA